MLLFPSPCAARSAGEAQLGVKGDLLGAAQHECHQFLDLKYADEAQLAAKGDLKGARNDALLKLIHFMIT